MFESPLCDSCPMNWMAAGWPGLTYSVSAAWWVSPRCCHIVTMIAVDTLEPMVRQKLDSPDALAIWSTGRPER